MNWEIFLRDALGMKKSMFFKNNTSRGPHGTVSHSAILVFSRYSVSFLVKIGLCRHLHDLE